MEDEKSLHSLKSAMGLNVFFNQPSRLIKYHHLQGVLQGGEKELKGTETWNYIRLKLFSMLFKR